MFPEAHAVNDSKFLAWLRCSIADSERSSHVTCLRSFQRHIDVDRAFARSSLRAMVEAEIDIWTIFGQRVPRAANIARLVGSVANSADRDVNAGPQRRRRKGSIAR